MKNIFTIAVIFSCILNFSCENHHSENYSREYEYFARIIGFDLNCSTCILEFPYDSTEIKKALGESENNYYHAINLYKGDHEVGELLKVKIRKAEETEMKPCITLYPTYNFKSILITDLQDPEELIINDTIEIINKECKFNIENQFYLCLDSILEDSRCPEGAWCITAGTARIQFHFEILNETPVYFVLHTNTTATNQITIDQYKIHLLNLFPIRSFVINDSPLYKGKKRAQVVITKSN